MYEKISTLFYRTVLYIHRIRDIYNFTSKVKLFFKNANSLEL